MKRRVLVLAPSSSRNLLFFFVLLLVLVSPAASQARKPAPALQRSTGVGRIVIVRDAAFQSASLARDMTYRIILPADYETSQKRYPVLYLLHGLFGRYTDWESRTHLDDYLAGLPLIVAMPEGDDSWYTNFVSQPREKWEDYIIKDFIPYIDKTYRTIQDRHARAIAGLSMGGYGAMKFALKYPGTFIFAGSMSGALDVTRTDVTPLVGAAQQARANEIYGPAGSETRAANDVYTLATNVSNPSRLPYLWLACGTEDPWIASDHQFIDVLVKQKIAHFYEESAGAHNWQFWDEHLPPMLSLLMSRYFAPLSAAFPVSGPLDMGANPKSKIKNRK